MKSPKFNNGDIVVISPVDDGRGMTGKVIGVIHNIDGTFGYVVSHISFGGGSVIARTLVGEEEINLKREDQ